MEIDAENKIDVDYIPSTSSSDPNERKLARRLRIQKRVEAAEKILAIAEGRYEEPEPEKPLIDETIETCDDTLRLLYLEGNEMVTNIMVASDAKEVARREMAMEEKNLRLEKLKEESSLALEKLDEISSKWELIVQVTSPLELHQHMKDQKAKCLELIEQKNELIKSFQMELKLADEQFMKNRKEMYEELSLLTRRIDDQVLLMKKAYRIELDHVEESVDIMRKQLIEKHCKIWESFYNQRERNEVTNMSRKFSMVENFQEELHTLHIEHEEKYRSTKIQLETDIQILEQELEQVKALCLLNSEKLDYNFQVLKKREEENVYIKNHQKRRLNKLQDMVNSLKKKIEEKRESTEEEFQKLTKEVNRYHNNFIETEKKAIRFSKVNDDKFLNIWNMKEDEAKELVDKILTADMIIHEQILGLPWTRPAVTSVKKSDLPSYKAATSFFNSGADKDSISDITDDTNPIKNLEEVPEMTPETVEGHRKLLCRILESIADQSGFLMEEKLDELLQPYNEHEKNFVRLDNVFMAIGIKTEKDIETMKKLFLPYSKCLICEKKDTGGSIDYRDAMESFTRPKTFPRKQSILQIRELEEKVSKLRIQAREGGLRDYDETYEVSLKETSRDVEKENFDSRRFIQECNLDGITPGKRERRLSTRDSYEPTKSESFQGKEDNECNITHPLIIEKHYVLKALRDFVAMFHSDRCRILLGLDTRVYKRRFTVSRLLANEDILAYWDKYKELLPPKVEVLWNGIFYALTKYLSILQDRHDLNVKAQSIRRQNLELKRLLAFYRPKSAKKECALPVISSVPDEPIDPEELAAIVKKLQI